MFLVFLAVWIILNGKFSFEILLFGLAISALIYLFIWKILGYSPKIDLLLFKNFPLIIAYIGVLEYEILKSNFSVISLIFKKKPNGNAFMMCFKTDLKNDVSKVILANSITLTPGTITVSVDGDVFTVHCLHEKFSKGIESSVFVKLLKKMEEKFSI